MNLIAPSSSSTKLARFPNQEAIIKYINTLPAKIIIDTPLMTNNFQNSLNKVAKYFENREMPLNEIAEHVKAVLEEDYKSKKELADLIVALQCLTNDCKKIDEGTPSSFTLKMDRIHTNANIEKENAEDRLNIATKIYEQALIDVIEKATYTPPPEGEKSWTRHVPNTL